MSADFYLSIWLLVLVVALPNAWVLKVANRWEPSLFDFKFPVVTALIAGVVAFAIYYLLVSFLLTALFGPFGVFGVLALVCFLVSWVFVYVLNKAPINGKKKLFYSAFLALCCLLVSALMLFMSFLLIMG